MVRLGGTGYAKNNRAMASCQREAKEAGLGLWADDDPIPLESGEDSEITTRSHSCCEKCPDLFVELFLISWSSMRKHF